MPYQNLIPSGDEKYYPLSMESEGLPPNRVGNHITCPNCDRHISLSLQCIANAGNLRIATKRFRDKACLKREYYSEKRRVDNGIVKLPRMYVNGLNM